MVRRGAAASANELDSCLHKLARVARHVLRRAEINVAPLDRTGHACIGLCRNRFLRDLAEFLDSFKHGYRTNTAITPDDVSTPLVKFCAECFRAGAVKTIAVFVDGDERDNRDLRICRTTGDDGLMDLLEVSKGFQHEEIHAAFGERRRLLPERSAGFVKRCLSQRLDAYA